MLSDAWAGEEHSDADTEHQTSSQTGRHKTTSGRGTPIFGRHTARVTPSLETGGSEEGGGEGRSPDISIFTREGSHPSLVSIEETTGEKVVEEQVGLLAWSLPSHNKQVPACLYLHCSACMGAYIYRQLHLCPSVHILQRHF